MAVDKEDVALYDRCCGKFVAGIQVVFVKEGVDIPASASNTKWCFWVWNVVPSCAVKSRGNLCALSGCWNVNVWNVNSSRVSNVNVKCFKFPTKSPTTTAPTIVVNSSASATIHHYHDNGIFIFSLWSKIETDFPNICSLSLESVSIS